MKEQDPLKTLPLDDCMLLDRGQFIRRVRDLRERRKQGKPFDKGLEKLIADVAASCARAEQRKAFAHAIAFPDDLPIAERREEISEAIKHHQVVVIAGETGSGKTTQIPKICLELGRGVKGLIGHTQPRRIAARTVASRIAEELKTTVGDRVGYQVRFNDHSGENTQVKLMTDGILLAEIQHDRYLHKYDTLIIDEAHERSLNIDFLLGYIKQILPRRPDLKVIITSATIDVERFARHFAIDGKDALVINVSGRTYPVEIRYRPPVDADDDIYASLVEGVEELLALPQKGDILVFLSGEREIREASAALRKSGLPHLEVVPLYARLSLADQSRIFQPHRGIRVVLATNVAETSITVPGIRYVIDTGVARISRYSYRTKVQRLPVEAISQASANQRAGRCGRLSAGVCIRLYSEEDFNNRPPFTDPEIVRTNLAAVILQMLQMRIGDIRDFPFVEAPDNRLINDGFQLLVELEAVNGSGQLTDTGKMLSRLPVDPRLGRMLVAASQLGSLREVLVIAAMLSLQDPRERPADKRQAADEKHRRWQDKESDFSSILLLWEHFEEQRQALTRRKFADYCHQNFISYLRMREWRDLHHQLHLACRELQLKENPSPAGYDNLHRALLTGLLSHVGFRHEEREYLGVRNRKFHIFPGSGVVKAAPKWVMAAEMLETSKLYAHQVARIEPEWIPPLAGHLIRKNHSEPYYDSKRGQVMAFERQTLFGLTVVDRKPVPYGPIDPAMARQVFIMGALVAQGYRGNGEFFRHNQQLLKELEELEDRLRRRDIALDDEFVFAFYDQRIPADICGLKSFETWRKDSEKTNDALLFFNRDSLLARAHLQQAGAQFPKVIQWKGINYPISYRFEPGHKEDGVSVTIPVPTLHQAPNYLFEWLVPGLLRDKCIALVKTLPKAIRKQLVPVPDFVDRALPGLQADNTPLATALGHQLKRHTGLDIPVAAWQPEQLEAFYLITYKLMDEKGHFVASSKNLAELKQQFRERVQETIEQAAGESAEIRGLTRWSFGRLTESRRIRKGKLDIEVYPALVEENGTVSLKLLDNPEEAARDSLRGVVRLLMMQCGETVKYLRKQLFRGQELAIVAAGLKDHERLREDIIFAATKIACIGDGAIPRSEQEFQHSLERGKKNIVSVAQQLEKILVALLPSLKEIHQLQARHKDRFSRSVEETRGQLAFLFRPDFLFETGEFWLQQYPRYLKALAARLERLPGYPDRDDAFCAELQALMKHWGALRERSAETGKKCQAELEEFRYLVEEYRVSVFAQVLKTVRTVSGKRLQSFLADIETRLAGG